MVPKLPRISHFRPTPRTSLKPSHQTNLAHLRHSTLSTTPSSSSTLHPTNSLPPPSSFSSSSNSHSTVNQDEIAHFSRLSSLWWDERGEFGMLHKMNPVRMQFIREKLVCCFFYSCICFFFFSFGYRLEYGIPSLTSCQNHNPECRIRRVSTLDFPSCHITSSLLNSFYHLETITHVPLPHDRQK